MASWLLENENFLFFECECELGDIGKFFNLLVWREYFSALRTEYFESKSETTCEWQSLMAPSFALVSGKWKFFVLRLRIL